MTVKRYLAGLFIIGAVSGLGVALAPAATPSSGYSYGDDNCQDLKDPISVIFYGTAATTRVLAGYERGGPFQKDVQGNVTRHTMWKRHNTDNRFRQYARTEDGCEKNPGDTDLASAAGYGNDRWHMRMWQVNDQRAAGQNYFVKTTPHREDWYWGDGPGGKACGTIPPFGSHAVERGAVDRGPSKYERHGSGFDRGRRFLDRAYRHSSRHQLRRSYFGNTRSVKQCDGEYAGSNGQGLMILAGRDATR